jgi:hypothetical protein
MLRRVAELVGATPAHQPYRPPEPWPRGVHPEEGEVEELEIDHQIKSPVDLVKER